MIDTVLRFVWFVGSSAVMCYVWAMAAGAALWEAVRRREW